MCDLRAALSLAPGSPLCGGGFRRQQRLFVRPSVRRSRSRPVRLFRRRFPAAKALCATFRRRSRSRPARRPLFRRRCRSHPVRRFAAVSGGGKDFLCDLRAELSLTLGSPLCGGAAAHARFAASAALSLTLGSPLCGGGFRRRQKLFVRPSVRRSRSARLAALRRFPAAAKTFCATFGRSSRSRSARRLVRRSRLRPVRRFGAALGSPPVLKAVLKKTPALFFEHGRLLPHNFARFR